MKNLTVVGRPAGATLIASLLLPTVLAGCGSSAPPPAPVQASAPRMAPAAQSKPGMNTRQKVTLLAGAAAMYYLYRKYQRDNAAKLQQSGSGQIQYYRSKSQGYIYYRDPQTHQPIIVARPNQSLQVPENQAQEVSNFQGYNGAQQGETLDKYFQVQ